MEARSGFKTLLRVAVVSLFALCCSVSNSANPAALSGVVSSQEEGRMEGVLVSAKGDGSRSPDRMTWWLTRTVKCGRPESLLTTSFASIRRRAR